MPKSQKSMKEIKFLPILTTVTMGGEASDWRARIEEIKKLGLKEIALFPTALVREERYELYEELKKLSLERIPFVHLRTDMEVEEIDYLVENFKTEIFNIHTTINWPLLHDYSKYAKQIFIENGGQTVPTEEELNKFAGLCIDFSHWENNVILGDVEYDKQMKERIQKYIVGICHLSVIKEEPIPDRFNDRELQYDSHLLEKTQELDYLKKYAQYIPAVCAIELENSIEQQLEVKQYLENNLK